jgi:hypothetical protein
LIAEILKIEPLCTATTSFYTIKFEDRTVPEFMDFYRRMTSNQDNLKEVQLIMELIREIGVYGAQRRYFNRPEKNAYALPPKGKEFYIETGDFGIRLFCLVMNPQIVILLNGNRKHTLKATDPGSGVSRYFYMANSLYDILIRDKLNGIIEWDGKAIELLFEPDYFVNIKG